MLSVSDLPDSLKASFHMLVVCEVLWCLLYVCIQSPAFAAAGHYGQCSALNSWFLVAVEMLLVLA